MGKIFLLLVIYQVKHFACDYPLQVPWMLGKFKPYPKFILPLLAHAGVHGFTTFFIACCYKSWHMALFLGLVDLIVHFTVDRIKASPSMLGKFKALSATEMKTLLSLGICPGLHAPVSQDQQKVVLKSNTYFWWSLGADQLAHHLTHYAIIWMLL